MIEEQPIDSAPKELYILEKHKYPLWVKAFWFYVLLVSAYAIPHFLYYELATHRALNIKIRKAEQLFLNKEYNESFDLFNSILKKYPNFKKGKVRLAEMCFLMIPQSEDFYEAGIEYLWGEEFTRSERNEIEEFLPSEYQKDFRLCFERV